MVKRLSGTKHTPIKTSFIAQAALLAALAVIMHCVEALLPPLIAGVPVKLGLANIFTLLAVMRLGNGYAASIVVVRCLLGTLISGSVSSLPYSLVGALLSLLIMVLLEPVRRLDKLSPIGISTASAFMFNIGQLAVGCIAVGKAMLYYFPLMSLLSIPTGVFTGLIAYYIDKGIKNKNHA